MSIRNQQRIVNAELEKVSQRLVYMEEKLQAFDSKRAQMQKENPKYVLLANIVKGIDELSELGGSQLIWGNIDEKNAQHRVESIHHLLKSYKNAAEKIVQQQEQVHLRIKELNDDIHYLNDEALRLEELEELAKDEFIIERDEVDFEYHPMVMPWNNRGEDEKRFRKILLITLIVTTLLGYLIPMYEIPPPDKSAKVVVPERLAKFLMKKKKKPPPPPKKEKLAEESTKKKDKEKTKEKKKDTSVARKKAETSGLMAFKNDFADLMKSDIDKKLGAQAKISNSGRTAKLSTRSIITAEAGVGTGGINTATLSRNVGGAGDGIEGVAFSRIESAIGTDFAGEESPLSGGLGPSRTDEEIQIVFDRYKSALYRIYNRQLRQDPTLQGRMVLRLTIEENGKVSACTVDSSDMNSVELDKKITARVKRFNFGVKEGVPTITILYPIDFLPAT